jgi:hypothetical protein
LCPGGIDLETIHKEMQLPNEKDVPGLPPFCYKGWPVTIKSARHQHIILFQFLASKGTLEISLSGKVWGPLSRTIFPAQVRFTMGDFSVESTGPKVEHSKDSMTAALLYILATIVETGNLKRLVSQTPHSLPIGKSTLIFT